MSCSTPPWLGHSGTDGSSSAGVISYQINELASGHPTCSLNQEKEVGPGHVMLLSKKEASWGRNPKAR